MKNITKADWESEVINGGLVLVDFWADWCRPCQMMMPVLEQLENEVALLSVVKVNGDTEVDLMNEFKIQGLPTMLLYKDGEQVWSLTGARPFASMVEKIAPYL
jgi:thioredoxin 1